MNVEQLRTLVREEIEHALDEHFVIDSHPKFRRLVEAKLGRKFVDNDEFWTSTNRSWSEMMLETDGASADRELVEYYVNDAAVMIKELIEL